jgi:hypothetical protein
VKPAVLLFWLAAPPLKQPNADGRRTAGYQQPSRNSDGYFDDSIHALR